MPTEDMRVEDARFFVVGHAKSGTTWLERTLDSHPEILCRGAGMFFGKNRQTLAGLRVLHNVLLGCEGLREWHGQRAAPKTWTEGRGFEEDAALMTRAVIDALMRRELTLSGKRILGDRTPDHLTQVKEIYELYPGARIVHAVRDGRDVMVSSAHNNWRAARQGLVKIPDEEVRLRDAYFEDRESFLAAGRSIFAGDWLRDMARRWNRTVGRARRNGEKLFGDRYLEIRYEDHLRNPRETLGGLFRFLGASSSPEVVASVVEANSFERVSGRPRGEESGTAFLRKGIAGDWREVFTEHDRRVFKEEAGDLLVKLGYEEDLDW